MIRAAIVLVSIAAVLAGFGGSSTTAATRAGRCTKVAAPKPRSESRKPPTGKLDAHKTWTATLKTSCGSFTIRLDVKDSPHVVTFAL